MLLKMYVNALGKCADYNESNVVFLEGVSGQIMARVTSSRYSGSIDRANNSASLYL